MQPAAGQMLERSPSLRKEAAIMASESGFVGVGDIRLHYIRWRAERPSIMLLHGSTHCAGIWSPLAERLSAAGISSIALDLRGHGLSDKPERGYDWTRLRDDVLAVIDALELQDLLIAGHSRGGGIGLLAAAAAPDRVRGVCVYEPTQPEAGATATRIATLMDRALHRRSVFSSRDELLGHWRSRPAFRAWQEEYLQAYAQHGAGPGENGAIELRCPPAVEAQLYEELLFPGPWRGSRPVSLPVLAIYGELGGRIGKDKDPAAAARRLFPRLEISVMPGATHFGPMERPELFERALRVFAEQTLTA